MALEKVNEPMRFVVRGSLAFPVDMLRYDACWPYMEQDAHQIANTIGGFNDGPVDVTVLTRRKLTDTRWNSFGWKVVATFDRFGERVPLTR